MKVGDLVQKRRGRIDPYQQGTVGLVVDKLVVKGGPNPAFCGYWALVLYPGKRPFRYRPSEFEVVSENR